MRTLTRLLLASTAMASDDAGRIPAKWNLPASSDGGRRRCRDTIEAGRRKADLDGRQRLRRRRRSVGVVHLLPAEAPEL
jgi:hypothetical protein